MTKINKLENLINNTRLPLKDRNAMIIFFRSLNKNEVSEILELLDANRFFIYTLNANLKLKKLAFARRSNLFLDKIFYKERGDLMKVQNEVKEDKIENLKKKIRSLKF